MSEDVLTRRVALRLARLQRASVHGLNKRVIARLDLDARPRIDAVGETRERIALPNGLEISRVAQVVALAVGTEARGVDDKKARQARLAGGAYPSGRGRPK